MRVRLKNTGLETELATFLTPRGYHGYDSGQLEDMASDIRATSEAVGGLLATLVERRVLSLDEAADLAGKYEDVELVQEH